MTRSNFSSGFNLPPGCSLADIDRATCGADPSALEEAVLALLEKARFPESNCDAIMALVREGEIAVAEADANP